MPGYTNVFGGTTIYPSDVTYLPLNLTADVTLSWPIEQQTSGSDIVADIMDLSTNTPGLSVTMPDARQTTEGFTALFNNVGAQTINIKSATGAVIVSLVSGSAWQIYLTDNSTESGTWRTFQYGASVSVSDAAALAGSGLKAITTTLNQSMPVSSINATPYVAIDSDRAKVLMWTGGIGAFTLPDPAVVGADWYVNLRNSGSGNLTITPAAGQIDAAANLVLGPGDAAIVFTDGANYYSITSGGGSGGTSFNLVTINVAGTGNFVLSGAQLDQIGYKFTGVLTGTRNIVVPNTTQEYWVDNETTGAFSLFVKTAAQITGVEVLQTARAILYCDGTNVIAAETSAISYPIAIVNGGTGAITAAAARTNLGAYGSGSTILAGDGLVTTPSLSFASDTNTGIFHNAADDLGIAAGGSTAAAFGTTRVAIVLPLQLSVGSVAAPGLYFVGDTNSGLYWIASDYVGFTAGGVFQGGFSTNGLNLKDGSAAAPAFTFDADPDTGLFRNAINNLGFTTGGSLAMSLSVSALTTSAAITTRIGPDGSPALPAICWDADSNTGFYRIGADQLGFSEGGSGYYVGFRNIPQNVQGGSYTLVFSDAGKQIYRSAGGAATWTIPANASVAFPVGTTLTFINESATSVTIAITSDTLRFCPNGAVGSRTLAQYGMATAVKTNATTWLISGNNIT